MSAPLPNDTAVVLHDGTCHLLVAGRTLCGVGGGRPTQLVQVLVYLAVQWCPRCFRGGAPR